MSCNKHDHPTCTRVSRLCAHMRTEGIPHGPMRKDDDGTLVLLQINADDDPSVAVIVDAVEDPWLAEEDAVDPWPAEDDEEYPSPVEADEVVPDDADEVVPDDASFVEEASEPVAVPDEDVSVLENSFAVEDAAAADDDSVVEEVVSVADEDKEALEDEVSCVDADDATEVVALDDASCVVVLLLLLPAENEVSGVVAVLLLLLLPADDEISGVVAEEALDDTTDVPVDDEDEGHGTTRHHCGCSSRVQKKGGKRTQRNRVGHQRMELAIVIHGVGRRGSGCEDHGAGLSTLIRDTRCQIVAQARTLNGLDVKGMTRRRHIKRDRVPTVNHQGRVVRYALHHTGKSLVLAQTRG